MSNQTIAFFGATGGCVQSCLAHALLDGVNSRALARTPSKLQSMLLSQDGITQEILDKHLTIVQGNAQDVEAVKEVLSVDGGVVNSIASGLGMSLSVSFSLQPFKTSDSTICADAAGTVIQALRELLTASPQAQKPAIAVVSSTGVTGPSDVPFGYKWLYQYVLAGPHADKRKMEETVSGDQAKEVFRAVTIVRPTILIGDHSIASGKGYKQLRAGTQANPTLGYFVKRADVGEWIFHEVLQASDPSEFARIVDLSG